MSQRLIETCRRALSVAVLLSSVIGCGSETHDDMGGSSGGAGGQMESSPSMGGRKSTAPRGGASGMSTGPSKPTSGAGGKSGAAAEMDAGMDDDAGKQSGSGMGTSAACAACEHKHDDNPSNNCGGRCEALMGNTDGASPKPNVSRVMLCHEILDCFHRTHCAGPNYSSSDCYCGAGADATACFENGTLKPTGPCKDLIEAGAETTDFSDIAMRFSDATYAVGAALTMFETCDFLYCDKECL